LESITLGAYTESTPKQEHTYDQPAEYTVKITGNIEGMKCSDCGITTLDVNLSTLETLSCSGNRLTSLDMSHCPELKTLYCNVNKELSNLDISKNSKLEFLNCNSIKIENPDFSKNPELKTLYCNSNHLKSLDVSKNTKLTCLVCSYNEITTLDVSKNPDLEQFYCDDNKLTALDVSRNSKLSIVQCEKNQLSEDGLNALFNTLHNTDIGHRKSIYIRKNPGIAACDKSLAEQKEWIVVSE
jgi:Leucine-rich repeat (LRR) protein